MNRALDLGECLRGFEKGAGRALLNHNSASDYERDKKKMDFGRKLRTKIGLDEASKNTRFFSISTHHQ